MPAYTYEAYALVKAPVRLFHPNKKPGRLKNSFSASGKLRMEKTNYILSSVSSRYFITRSTIGFMFPLCPASSAS